MMDKQYKIGCQLYSVKDFDFLSAEKKLQELSAIGYDFVESASNDWYKHSIDSFADLCKSANIEWLTAHFMVRPSNAYKERFDSAAFYDLCKRLEATNVKYIVQPYLVASTYKSFDKLNQASAILQEQTTIANHFGIEMLFHNHDAEFKLMGKSTIYDIILANNTIDVELDLYWIAKSIGITNAVQAIKQLNQQNQIKLCHVKSTKELGTFVKQDPFTDASLKELLYFCYLGGCRNFIVEHEDQVDLAKSYSWLNKTMSEISNRYY